MVNIFNSMLLGSATFNPLTYSPALWFDGNDPAGTGTQPADDSSLATFVDKSASALNVTQGTGALQPIFNTGRQNGKAGVTFNGTTQFMQAAAFNALVNPAAFTLFVVCKTLGGETTFRTPISTRAFPGSLFRGYWVYAAGTNKWTFNTGQIDGDADAVDPNVTSTTDQAFLLQAHCVSGTKDFTVASTTATSVNTFQANAGSSLRVGAGANEGAANFFFNGDIYELLLYPSVLTTNQTSAVSGYLASKWAVAL